MSDFVEISSLGALLGRPSMRPTSDRRYRSTIIATYSIGPETSWEWQPQPRDGSELALVAQTSSKVEVETGGKDPVSGRGLFLHPHQVAHVRATQLTSVLCAWIPWRVFAELDDGTLTSFGVPQPTPMMLGARAFVSMMLRQEAPPTVHTDYLVEKQLCDMVFSAVLEAGPDRHLGGKSTITFEDEPIDHARRLMILRRADHSFCPADLAHELHMSTRQLQRVFAAVGSSPADELRRMRVELAVKYMHDPDSERLPLEHLAKLAGFSNAAALRRAFAARGLSVPARPL